MKKVLVFSAALLLMLGGCARHYVITLSNGAQIGARSKPKLNGNVYTYKDALGNDSQIMVGRVTEIAPASMTQDSGGRFLPAPAKR